MMIGALLDPSFIIDPKQTAQSQRARHAEKVEL